MKACRMCARPFDPELPLDDPAQQAGQLMAEEEYGDAGALCGDCLASRGRLAMMYRSDYFAG
ncbi:MAG: hypothetical protein C0618_03310 [Desulfuromonas sp.]|nr:MAG: hypothetical protein C0618_03310 [Desulfuromonas sp.]